MIYNPSERLNRCVLRFFRSPDDPGMLEEVRHCARWPRCWYGEGNRGEERRVRWIGIGRPLYAQPPVGVIALHLRENVGNP